MCELTCKIKTSILLALLLAVFFPHNELVRRAQDNWIGSGVIAHHATDGVFIDGSATRENFISEVCIYDNGGLGINLDNGANGSIQAPGIASTTLEAGSENLRESASQRFSFP
jgi:hypothetical protein